MAIRPVGMKLNTATGFQPAYTSLTHAHRDLVERIMRLDGAIASTTVHPDFLESLRRRAATLNTHATTSIEGNPLDTREVAAIAENPRSARRVPTQVEVKNHLRYYQSLTTRPPRTPLTEQEVLDTNASLLAGVLPSGVGAWKTTQNVITDVETGRDVFYPTPPERTAAEVQALLAWYTNSPLPTPIRVGLWAHEFQCIHPFRDGNGRTGRALTHRLLVAAGFEGMKYVALDAQFLANKREYMDAIASVQTTRWDYDRWLTFFLTSLENAYLEAVQALQTYASVPAELDGLKRAIVEWVVSHGGSSFSRGDFMKSSAAAGYHEVSVSQALSALVKLGYLEPRGQSRGKRYMPGRRLLHSAARRIAPEVTDWSDE